MASVSTNGKTQVTRENAAAVAVGCFKRFGVHRTSMADIADSMGVARQTIYRLFETRSELLEVIATARVRILTQKVRKLVETFATLEEALVDGIAYSVKLGREDTLLAEIVHQGGDAHFQTFLFGGTEQVQMAMLDAWGPLIVKSREAGTLSRDFSDQEAIEWICNIGAVLNMRDDYDEKAHRRILEQFVVPSLTK
jgi:AcrR family transcriptional regulator